MGAKQQLSPNERLARKRAAARLRQQRCRARKRQAMLEQKRIQQEQMSRSEAQPMSTQHAASAFRVRRSADGDTISALPSSTQQPIYKVVSFESQRSFEETSKGQSKSSDSIVTVATPPRKGSAETTSAKSTDSSATPVPDKEAAAIAAMLSLKGSPTVEKKPQTPPRVEKPQREQTRPAQHYGVQTTAKVPLYRTYNNVRYEKARYAMPPQRMPHYYNMSMSHPPRPHPQYRYGYPSSYHRFVRYE